MRMEARFCVFKVVSHNIARFIDQMVKQQKLTVTRATRAFTYVQVYTGYQLVTGAELGLHDGSI